MSSRGWQPLPFKEKARWAAGAGSPSHLKEKPAGQLGPAVPRKEKPSPAAERGALGLERGTGLFRTTASVIVSV